MWESLISYLAKELTIKFGFASVIIITLCWLVRYLAKKILEDKDKQITLLSEENKKYKEMFMEMLDKQFNFDKDKEIPKK